MRTNPIRLRPMLCGCVFTYTLEDSETNLIKREASVQLEVMEKICDAHKLLSPLDAHQTIISEGNLFNKAISVLVPLLSSSLITKDDKDAKLGEIAQSISMDSNRNLVISHPDIRANSSVFSSLLQTKIGNKFTII